MTKISDIQPTESLAKTLNGVKLQISATETVRLRCYADNQMPNKGLGDEFFTAMVNGKTVSQTEPFQMFKGNVALGIYTKLRSDGTVNNVRLRKMIDMAVQAADRKCSDGIFFEIDPTNVITPTTTNLNTGYATKIINVAWHTTDSFHNS